MLGVLVTGMLVPYDDKDLLRSSGDAAQSPYVIAITRARIKGYVSLCLSPSSRTEYDFSLPHVINAAVFSSAFSAGKFALRALSQSLNKEFGKENIHASVTLFPLCICDAEGCVLRSRSRMLSSMVVSLPHDRFFFLAS